jgi:hypothetical protein
MLTNEYSETTGITNWGSEQPNSDQVFHLIAIARDNGPQGIRMSDRMREKLSQAVL